jgi:predicted dithiol-disulfide oxidoreductase (DUF899 family)
MSYDGEMKTLHWLRRRASRLLSQSDRLMNQGPAKRAARNVAGESGPADRSAPAGRPARREITQQHFPNRAETAVSERAFPRKDFVMTNQPTDPSVSAIRDAARPPVADRAAFQTELDRLRVREKAHTREGDAIAAARRRLPMVEVDPQTPLIGADGPVPLIDIFDGRSQLIAYFQMWHTGRPAAEQCEGCTFSTSHINQLSYLNSRDVSYATFCEGPYEENSRYRDFMGWTIPWYSVPQDSVDRLIADRHFGILVGYLRNDDKVYETYWTTGRGNELMAPSYGLLDLTVYGRQEFWEDSPVGWPQRWGSQGGQFRLDGRPTAQWPRIQAGHDDDLGPMPTGWTACSCSSHTEPPATKTN